MQLPSELGAVTYTHVCYLTDDLDQSLAAFAALGVKETERVEFGSGVYAIVELPGFANYGSPTSGAPMRIELLMPTSEGNVYSDHLARHGKGLHHIGILVPDFEQYLEAFTAAGCKVMVDARQPASSAVNGTREAKSKDGWMDRNPTYQMCYLDCSAIGFPTVEMVSY